MRQSRSSSRPIPLRLETSGWTGGPQVSAVSDAETFTSGLRCSANAYRLSALRSASVRGGCTRLRGHRCRARTALNSRRIDDDLRRQIDPPEYPEHDGKEPVHLADIPELVVHQENAKGLKDGPYDSGENRTRHELARSDLRRGENAKDDHHERYICDRAEQRSPIRNTTL